MRRLYSSLGNDFYVDSGNLYYQGERLECISSGEEGSVYRFFDKAIKVYHLSPRKRVLSLDMIEYLKKISAQRIVLPEGALHDYDSFALAGYVTPYIDGDSEAIWSYLKDKLLEEFLYLYDDFSELGKKQVVISDLRASNYISNQNCFYFIDPGDYYLSSQIEDTTEINCRAFTEFVLQDLIYPKLVDISLQDGIEIQRVRSVYRQERYCMKHHSGNLVSYLEQNMEPLETFSGYVKRRLRS